MCSEITCKNQYAFNELIIGDYDSLLNFGTESQSQLRYFSKTMSNLISGENQHLDDTINEIVNQISNYQNEYKIHSFRDKFMTQKQIHKLLIKEYNYLLVYIDKITLELQLQQAKIIKETKIMEYLNQIIVQCNNEFDRSITEGLEIQKKVNAEYNKIMDKADVDEEEFNNWKGRLSKRIEDLKLSKMVGIQGQAQLKMIQDNNRQLIDRITSTVTSTIPIWRDQVTLLLGMENISRSLSIQDRVMDATGNSLKEINKCKSKLKADVMNDQKISQNNKKLVQALEELSRYEEKNFVIKEEMSKSLTL